MTTTTKEQFKKAIEEFYGEEETTLEDINGDIDDMARMFYWVINESNETDVEFDIAKREDSDSSWLQCDYYSKKLGYTIIIHNDYDYNYDDIDAVINELMRMQEVVEEIEKFIVVSKPCKVIECKNMVETNNSLYCSKHLI